MIEPLRTVGWTEGGVWLIDQTALPERLETVRYTEWREVAGAIQTMVVRGAPAIGCTAALGMALCAQRLPACNRDTFLVELEKAAAVFRAARPTAVNLCWAVDRLMALARRTRGDSGAIRTALLAEALGMLEEDVEANRRMGAFGAALLPDDGAVLTHCNAGALATVGFGTALGVIRAAVEAGKKIHVFADETRPRLQGMKLTAWELARDGIPVTIIADSMAPVLMRQGGIDCVVVGADRIACNGDTANKIGTYGAALAARYHNIPFYVAAPFSTIDFGLANGEGIPIERRDDSEMTHVNGTRIAPEGVPVLNPSFDVTPADLITAFITERGVLQPPFAQARSPVSP